MSTGDVVPQWPAEPLPAREAEVRKARRSLFGPIDHRESERFVQNELQKQYQLDQEKWNFDFGSELPLSSLSQRYEWESVPAAGRTRDADRQRQRINGGCPDAASGKRIRQPHITDFMKKRKHASGSKVRERPGKSIRRSST